MTGRFAHILTLLALIPTLALAQPPGEGTDLPFSMPVPDGWRTETIQFPLEFAPSLPYSGLEELRFAPGMFEPDSDEFWSYAFVWWVDAEDPTDLESLAAHLETYFRGLAGAVAESRDIEVGDARFGAEIHATGEHGFAGTAETLDAFVTGRQVVLNLRGEVRSCPSLDRRAVIFELSPQDPSDTIWARLDTMRYGFRCVHSGPRDD